MLEIGKKVARQNLELEILKEVEIEELEKLKKN